MNIKKIKRSAKKAVVLASSVAVTAPAFAADAATQTGLDWGSFVSAAAFTGITAAISTIVAAAFGIRVAVKGVSLLRSGLKAG